MQIALALVAAVAMANGKVAGAVGWQSTELAASWTAHPGGIALDGDAMHLALRHGRGTDWKGLAYSYCPSECAEASSWAVVSLQDASTGRSHPFIRVDAWGRPRIGFWQEGVLKYAACDTNCTSRNSWRIAEIERVEQPDINGRYFYYIPDFELDALGRPRFAYPYRHHTGETVAHLLKYASCDAGCTTAANWQTTTLTAVSLPATWPMQADLDFDGTSPRIGYWAWDKVTNDQNMGYAACDNGCADEDNWQHLVIPEPFPTPYGIAFAVHGARAHLTYANVAGGLYYSTCEADCLSDAAWSTPALIWIHQDPSGARLALTTEGLPRIAVLGRGPDVVDTGRGYNAASQNLTYLTCDTLALCGSSAGWQAQAVDGIGKLVEPHALALDGSRPRIAYSPWHTSDRVGLTWCDSCGTAGPREPRPASAPPATGPGSIDPTPTPTLTTSPTATASEATATPSSPPTTPPTSPTTTPPTSPTTASSGTGSGSGGSGSSGSGGGSTGSGGSSGSGGGSTGSGGSSGSGGGTAVVTESPSPSPVPQSSPHPPSSESTERPVRASGAGVQRTSGRDRISTAVSISRSAFDPELDWAFVANAGSFPDALAAGPAAGKLGAPILLVNRDSIPEGTAEELRRLKPERIAVLGGPNAIAPQTELVLATASRRGTVRVAGHDRYGTAAAISRTWTPGGTSTVYLASGNGFADALAGGAAAAQSGSPLLLTAPDALPSSTGEELDRLMPEEVVVLGGHAVVTERVAAQVRARGLDVRRIAGTDRYGTTAAITSQAFGSAEQVFVATGTQYPDALAAVPAASQSKSPLLLVGPDAIPPAIEAELERLGPSGIVILGGMSAVSPEIERQLHRYAQ